MAQRRRRGLSSGPVAVAVAAACACGRVDFADPAMCDLKQPFGTPVELTSLDPDGGEEGTIRLLPDELTGYYWSSQGHGSAQQPTLLYRVTRADLASPFTAVELPALDGSGFSYVDPTATADDTLLLYRRSHLGDPDTLFMALASGSGTFGSGAPVTALNSGSGEEQPFIPLFGEEIYFSSHRTGSGDLYRATRTGSTFGSATLVTVSMPTFEEGDPMLSPDGLDLYYRSDRGSASHQGFNIWMVHRTTVADDFGSAADAAEVQNLNSDSDEGPSWMSPDGCRLYLSSNRIGNINEVFVATRP